nr:signal peptidase I [Metabacillus kandeliae]
MKNIISTVITAVLFLSLCTMIFFVLSSKASGGEPQLLGYQLKTVLSGSMEPGIHTGSLIAVKPGGDMTRFVKGDVITFHMDEKTIVTHRVLSVVKRDGHVFYETKGDSNQSPDSQLLQSSNVIAEYSGFTIPYAGYFSEFAKSKQGNAILMIIPGILLLIYSVFTVWKALSKLEVKTP